MVAQRGLGANLNQAAPMHTDVKRLWFFAAGLHKSQNIFAWGVFGEALTKCKDLAQTGLTHIQQFAQVFSAGWVVAGGEHQAGLAVVRLVCIQNNKARKVHPLQFPERQLLVVGNAGRVHCLQHGTQFRNLVFFYRRNQHVGFLVNHNADESSDFQAAQQIRIYPARGKLHRGISQFIHLLNPSPNPRIAHQSASPSNRGLRLPCLA